MYIINKISSNSTVDYAAEELKKYLRMMMPECGDVKIKYAPESKDGFRLGLMQDLGLDVSDAEEPDLDDILYIDTDECGGIIAGDNPRSVLLAVYEYLRHNGCRWLFPGVDGEFIPVKDIKAVKYRFKPTSRYRGLCNEGSESQRSMVEAIEFLPKVGMNVLMTEFFIPTSYYRRHYMHEHNDMNRPPEPVTPQTVLQWKRACECEVSKRGLSFHDIGHGWTAAAFDIDTSVRSYDGDNDSKLTPEQRASLALVNGERKLWNQTPNHTQMCMSNSAYRRRVANFVADHAQKFSNSDYLHVWLGDGVNNHCECDECVKKTPSDWYVILLNEIDAELSARKLNTRIVFILYADSVWPPLEEALKNQKRFTFLVAPISRRYTDKLSFADDGCGIVPYKRNQNELPDNFTGIFKHILEWRKMWKGAEVAYEYHFWRHQYYDVGGIRHYKVVNHDIKFYGENGVSGVIEDGSQRSFFPTGLSFYTYARTLFDSSLTAEEIAEDYFSCAFGEDWKSFYNYLEELGETFDSEYLTGRKSSDLNRSKYYSPEKAKELENVNKITENGRKLIAEHYNSEYRIRTVSVRLLEKHAKYAELFANALIPKALGNDDEADKRYAEFMAEMGKDEAEIETCYDHGLAFYSLERIFESRTNTVEEILY